MAFTKVSLSSKQRVLDKIITSFGGPTQFLKFVRTVLGDHSIQYQSIINWRERGGIPLVKAIPLADKMKINTALLNYDSVVKMNGKQMPAWKELLKELDRV